LENSSFEDYNNYESTIEWFWMCSWGSKWRGFNWNKAFESFKEPIRHKLAEHGILEYEDFKEVEEEYLDMMNADFDPFIVDTNYVQFTKDDVLEGILMSKYDVFRDAFYSMEEFVILDEMLDEINNYKKLSLQEKIELFDKIIHAQHVSGDIFDVGIGELRKQFERDMRKMN
jgi:hypothetical protein